MKTALRNSKYVEESVEFGTQKWNEEPFRRECSRCLWFFLSIKNDVVVYIYARLLFVSWWFNLNGRPSINLSFTACTASYRSHIDTNPTKVPETSSWEWTKTNSKRARQFETNFLCMLRCAPFLSLILSRSLCVYYFCDSTVSIFL